MVREKSKSEWKTVMIRALGILNQESFDFALRNKKAVKRLGPEKQNRWTPVERSALLKLEKTENQCGDKQEM